MNKRKYHFIAGLPRSGSTLLTSILNQNPKFYSEISNPLGNFIFNIVETYSSDPTFRTICDADRLKSSVKGLMDGYYAFTDKQVVFNCNRGWTRYVEYLHELNPQFKIICMVRNYADVLNSFEALHKKRGLIDNTAMYSGNTLNVYARTNFLGNDSFVRYAYNNLREAYFGPYRKNLLLIEYLDLINQPEDTMESIYNFIDEPYYKHDFNNVAYSFDEYDQVLRTKNLHKVSSKVGVQNTPMVLPPDLYDSFKNWEFWR
jgi:sulfotransferase